jgi:hypothetical protein
VIIRRSIWLASVLVLMLIAGGFWIFHEPQKSAVEGLSPEAVRNIQTTLSNEKWRRVARCLRGLDFKLACARLREIAAGRVRVIRLDHEDTAFVDADDRWNSERHYRYQLERVTNGWKVVGYQYIGRGSYR